MNLQDQNNSKKPNDKKSGVQSYLKYTSAGFQMIAVILIFTYAGIYLDKRFDTKPWLMLLFTLSGIFGSLYQLIRKLTSEDKK